MTPPPTADAVLREYRAQILRWNRQISLISRQDSEAVLDRLLDQCRDGLALLQARFRLAPGLAYYDLGSGGGLPGVVWHVLMSAQGLRPRTVLVEPREKRAWFLDRLKGLAGMPDFRVQPKRWGDGEAAGPAGPSPGSPAPGHPATASVLISLKALKLSDPEILRGLRGFSSPQHIVIARYHPPAGPESREPEAELQIFGAGAEVAIGDRVLRARGPEVLPGGDFSLVASSYEAPSS